MSDCAHSAVRGWYQRNDRQGLGCLRLLPRRHRHWHHRESAYTRGQRLCSCPKLIYVPTSAASAFWGAIPGSTANGDGSYNYPCNYAGPVGISFPNIGNLNFAIADLNIGSVGGGMCAGAVLGQDIQDANGQNFAIVGDTFIKSYYTLFKWVCLKRRLRQLLTILQLRLQLRRLHPGPQLRLSVARMDNESEREGYSRDGEAVKCRDTREQVVEAGIIRNVKKVS